MSEREEYERRKLERAVAIAHEELWPCDPVEVGINLIDALRAYLHVEADVASDLLDEGQITRADVEQHEREHLAPLRAALRRLEDWQIDPSLGGLLRGRKLGGPLVE